ncbi:hypothetical protein Bbelb_166740 [Branchiostoma belcheri]|nr:hypothetical protein Bbelb_166740 [Branchiostoma belcheri]
MTVSDPARQPAESAPGFAGLPEELWGRVFAYLDPVEDRVVTLALVCKKWSRVLRNTPDLWRTLSVCRHLEDHLYDNVAAALHAYGQHVHVLTWKSGVPVTPAVLALLPTLTNLRVLGLPVVWDREHIYRLMPLSGLEEVQINGAFELTDGDLELVARSFPELREVTFTACWDLSPEGVLAFLEQSAALHSLRLKLNVGLPLHDVRSDQAMLQGANLVLDLADSRFAHLLTVLHLNFVPLELDELWSCMNHFTRIRKLVVTNCEQRLVGKIVTFFIMRPVFVRPPHQRWTKAGRMIKNVTIFPTNLCLESSRDPDTSFGGFSSEPTTVTEIAAFVGKLQACAPGTQRLQGVRLRSGALQKLYLYNLWSVSFVSLWTPQLRSLHLDAGLENLEHLEVFAPKLRKLQVDGSGVLSIRPGYTANNMRGARPGGLTLSVKSTKLSNVELYNCELLDGLGFTRCLGSNITVTVLSLGSIGMEALSLDQNRCPSLRELRLLADFRCTSLHLSCPTLRRLCADCDVMLPTLQIVSVVARHVDRLHLANVPGLQSLTVQCDRVDLVEINTTGNVNVCLENCAVQAVEELGTLRLLDCQVQSLVLSAPLVRQLVLQRCMVTDYSLCMALRGCPNIQRLQLQKCSSLTRVSICRSLLQYLHLLDCRGILQVELTDCPKLLALDIGQCPNVRLFVQGSETTPNKYSAEMVWTGPPGKKAKVGERTKPGQRLRVPSPPRNSEPLTLPWEDDDFTQPHRVETFIL